MDDFFLADPDAKRPSQNKRKRAPQASKGSVRRSKREEDEDSEDEVGAGTIDDMDLEGDRGTEEEDSGEEDRRETAAQKRLRLAKRYLAKVREEAADVGEVDAAQLDRDIIANRLRDEALESIGKLFHAIADKYANIDLADPSRVRTFKSGKNHQLSITSVAIAIPSIHRPNTPHQSASHRKPIYIYSASKDASIVKWDFWTGKRLHFIPGGLKPTKKLIAAYGTKMPALHVGHKDHILSIAASSDGQFLATAGRDKAIHIWSVGEDKHLGSFTQHRDAVSSVTFRKGHNQLYSASFDRTIKLWNVDEMAYVETLYGHQDQITCIDTLARERCITCGARDRTVRLWKIIEESQLIFRGGGSGTVHAAGEDLVVMDGVRKVPKVEKQANAAGGSLDAVALIDEELFISGSDTGAISLWTLNRKKPLFTKLRAHGPGSRVKSANPEGDNGEEDKVEDVDSSDGKCWITALATVRYSDLFASGAGDGYIRLWKLSKDKRRFALLGSIPMPGFVNSLVFFEAPPMPTSLDKDADTIATTNSNPSTAASRLARARAAIAKGELTNKPLQKDVLYLAVGLGQEHRLGRWWRDKRAKNSVKIISLAPEHN
ncbi:uncharacterized protein SPPG_08059 [Spizellomyces punctatus DAOM BR117]|uniref:Uncharacterized protein n=1 Tax=Spizellomyces punctatus (strain DAOM BR117) TaxID=645134 RepID=A0A0L0H6W2_SPIPD|nr:uncharacterized protein SPPG_08059 [Spizellomyces punctatus DAOM BR117]KNC96468.1 hypothetical protein SPPG_08059 [Spizellomyces punctatus DAOM BR117]|eukprot:XP_016604508.1 hypothetical protein SPPG_08059 [Spizellomyces punctatus DAOM BR117]